MYKQTRAPYLYRQNQGWSVSFPTCTRKNDGKCVSGNTALFATFCQTELPKQMQLTDEMDKPYTEESQDKKPQDDIPGVSCNLHMHGPVRLFHKTLMFGVGFANTSSICSVCRSSQFSSLVLDQPVFSNSPEKNLLCDETLLVAQPKGTKSAPKIFLNMFIVPPFLSIMDTTFDTFARMHKEQKQKPWFITDSRFSAMLLDSSELIPNDRNQRFFTNDFHDTYENITDMTSFAKNLNLFNKTLPDGGHMWNRFVPDQIRALILGFLETLTQEHIDTICNQLLNEIYVKFNSPYDKEFYMSLCSNTLLPCFRIFPRKCAGQTHFYHPLACDVVSQLATNGNMHMDTFSQLSEYYTNVKKLDKHISLSGDIAPTIKHGTMPIGNSTVKVAHQFNKRKEQPYLDPNFKGLVFRDNFFPRTSVGCIAVGTHLDVREAYHRVVRYISCIGLSEIVQSESITCVMDGIYNCDGPFHGSCTVIQKKLIVRPPCSRKETMECRDFFANKVCLPEYEVEVSPEKFEVTLCIKEKKHSQKSVPLFYVIPLIIDSYPLSPSVAALVALTIHDQNIPECISYPSYSKTGVQATHSMLSNGCITPLPPVKGSIVCVANTTRQSSTLHKTKLMPNKYQPSLHMHF